MRKNWLSASPFFSVSVVLFVSSLPLNGFCVNSDNCWPGYALVPFGWLEFVAFKTAGIFPVVAWAANPLWVFAVFTGWREKDRISFALALCSLVCGLCFFLVKGVIVSEAGGEPYPVTHYGPGLWLWLAALATGVVAGFAVYSKKS